MLTFLLTPLLATGFTFLMTAAGASMVFFFKNDIPDRLHRIFLGFAAGVMIAASVWSLLLPSIEQAEALGMIGWLPAAGGFLFGNLFLLFLTHYLPLGTFPKKLLLIVAITLHNIPEGMAVGLAWPLALGIGIQNFPEGAAVSLPLRKRGFSRSKAFLFGSATGIVEPIFGTLAALLAKQATLSLPWMLSFAAGAMFYVVVEELIPESHPGNRSHEGVLGFIIGFLLMMILDVSLG
jgi:ZIP family zinc transporter